MRTKPFIILGVLLALLLTALATLSPAAEAATVSIRVSKTSAIPGQWLVISGKLPSKGVKRLELERTLYHGIMARGKSKANGSYSFRIRMLSMPVEGFKVHVVGGPASKTVSVTSIRQDIILDGGDGEFTAQVIPAMTRNVMLQRRTSATGWENVVQKTTGPDGWVDFSAPNGPAYRAVAMQKDDILSYYSVPVVTEYPNLDENPSNLGGPGQVYNPQIDSGTSAAAKYKWWPAAQTWDWEYATGMGEYTNWAEGTGRSSLTYGGLWQNSGSPRPAIASYGGVSSTYRKAGFTNGNWEIKSRLVQKDPGFTPYTARYSLVPAGTPDGVRPRSEIVIAEHTGYTDQTSISVRDGSNEYRKVFGGFAHNRENWHAYAVQITDKRVTWLVNRKIVGSWNRTAGLQGNLVPRLELVDVDGQRMTYSTLATDWIRYFKIKPGANLKGSTAGFSVTPLASKPAPRVTSAKPQAVRIGARAAAVKSLATA